MKMVCSQPELISKTKEEQILAMYEEWLQNINVANLD
jgi:hypothetical protein